jgi:hypothetical protein
MKEVRSEGKAEGKAEGRTEFLDEVLGLVDAKNRKRLRKMFGK